MLKRTAGRMSKAGRPQICPRSPRGSPRRSPRGSPRSLAGRTVPTGGWPGGEHKVQPALAWGRLPQRLLEKAPGTSAAGSCLHWASQSGKEGGEEGNGGAHVSIPN